MALLTDVFLAVMAAASAVNMAQRSDGPGDIFIKSYTWLWDRSTGQPWSFVYDVATCTKCFGFYVGLFLWLLRIVSPGLFRAVAVSFVASKAAWLLDEEPIPDSVD